MRAAVEVIPGFCAECKNVEECATRGARSKHYTLITLRENYLLTRHPRQSHHMIVEFSATFLVPDNPLCILPTTPACRGSRQLGQKKGLSPLLTRNRRFLPDSCRQHLPGYFRA